LAKSRRKTLKKCYPAQNHAIFIDNMRKLNANQKDILQELLRMEDDPQFEYTERELRFLVEKLMKNEDNPLNQINEMRFEDTG
jgi:hypothetical protein